MGLAGLGAVRVTGGGSKVRPPRDPKLPPRPTRASATLPARVRAAASAITARLRRLESFIIVVCHHRGIMPQAMNMVMPGPVLKGRAGASAPRLLLELIDPLGGLGLVELRIVRLRLVSLLGERLEVRCLSPGHRLVTRDPILRVLDLVGVRIGVGLGIIDLRRVLVTSLGLFVLRHEQLLVLEMFCGQNVRAKPRFRRALARNPPGPSPLSTRQCGPASSVLFLICSLVLRNG